MTASGLHLIRRQQRALARWVLVLFCLVWIQAALAPCAMAVVPDGMAGTPEEHCAYCPPAAADGAHTDGAAGTCAYPDQPQADARLHAAGPLALAVPLVAYVPAPVADHAVPVVDPARPPEPAGPPLPVAYCRFLK